MKNNKVKKFIKPKIIIAKSAGFCFGVRRAITLAEKTAENKNQIYTFGPLIHNPQEVARLNKNGIKVIQNPGNLKKATLILRTHGISANILAKLQKKSLKLVDATCPFVKRAQDIVKKISKEDSQIIVVGEKTHPEIVALVSYGEGKCNVVEKKSDLKKLELKKNIFVVSQTTQTPENFKDIVNYLNSVHSKVKTYNTICRATIQRQTDASRLAGKVDKMIVVGGKNSGNTRRLAEICQNYTVTYHIETAAELKPAWFQKIKKIGITAGASTPDWIINDVKCKITDIYSKELCKKQRLVSKGCSSSC